MNLQIIKEKKLNKEGFSLVEIICALAILAIVGVVIVSFITISTQTYKDGALQTDVQYEAQQASNQIKDIIMGANAGVAMVPAAGGANAYLAVYNYDFTIDGAGTRTDLYSVVKIEYDATNKKLMYGEMVFNSPASIDLTFAANNLMAQHVSAFNVDTSNVDTDKIVNLNLQFTAEAGGYTVNAPVTIRNKVIASVNTDEIYSGARIELNKVVKEVNIYYGGIKCTGETLDFDRPLASTNNYAFKAEVEAYGYGKDVTWTISGSRPSASSVDSNGMVLLSSAETNTLLTLTATSVADTSVSASVYIRVKWAYVNNLVINETSSAVDIRSTGSIATYEFTPDIVYENEEMLADSEKGYTWELLPVAEGDLVGITGTLSGSSIKVTCTYEASNKGFRVRVKSKGKTKDGDQIERTAEIGPIPPLSGPGATNEIVQSHLNTYGSNLSRNKSYVFSITTTNLENVSFHWDIVGGDGSNISLININSSSATLIISKDYDWNATANLTLKVKVSGTLNGTAAVTYEDSVNLTVAPVTMTASVTPTAWSVDRTSHLFGAYYTFKSSFSVNYSLNNIIVDSNLTAKVVATVGSNEIVNSDTNNGASHSWNHTNILSSNTMGDKAKVTVTVSASGSNKKDIIIDGIIVTYH